MGKHSEWRKLAKKARRKRVRQRLACIRSQLEAEEEILRLKTPGYKLFLENQAKEEQLRVEEEAKLAAERELEWKKVEEEAQRQWQELQKKLATAREERARQNEQIRQEWEKEQKRLKELEERKELELQEKLRQQELLEEKVNDFIENGGETPEHLKTKFETNPNKPECPFFQKTSTCRFYDVCSRNHIRPGISRMILIHNFFSDYSLSTVENEHGSDSSLEYEHHETYKHYKVFFYDVIRELETFGKIKVFKCCCNHESHLRGNVFVEYASTRAALKCYRNINGRWYGGKQLNAEFCSIISWKSAICGLFFGNRCPKGNACNFLHVFKNPKNLYNSYDHYHNNSNNKNNYSDNNPSDRRNWRWSESPERLPGSNSDGNHTKHKKRRRSKSRSWSQDRYEHDTHSRSYRSEKTRSSRSKRHSSSSERSRRNKT